MAQQLYFSRDSQMFLEIGTSVWKIPVLEGFSFSQATNTSDITLAEMESGDGSSRRGRRAFNDSLAPVDFSFSTYIRPFKAAGGTVYSAAGAGRADDGTNHHAVEEALWALFSSKATYSTSNFDFVEGSDVTSSHTSSLMTMDFQHSNLSALGPDLGANLYFELGDANKICYKLEKVVLNEASIDFDIDGIATINWTGHADRITDISKIVTVAGAISTTALVVDGTPLLVVATDDERRIHGTGATSDAYLSSITNTTTAVFNTAQAIANDTELTLLGPRATVDEGWNATNNFIRNRLTKVLVTAATDPAGQLESTYALTLTGGNITLSNNVTYLTPEELGIVNVPIGHVTGARTFGGSMTCYLTEDTDTTNASKDFFEDLTSALQRAEVTNDFRLQFLIGGGSSGAPSTPGIEVDFPKCHVDIPTHSVEDIITLETTFSALPESLDSADEVIMKYIGATPVT